MVRIRLDAMLGRVFHFPARVECSLQIFDRRGVGQIALVVLDDEGHLRQVVAVLGHVVVEILHGLEVRFHSLRLRIADEHDAIDVLEYELAAGVVINLAGDGIEVETRLEAANGAEVHG